MTPEKFELLLSQLADCLTEDVSANPDYRSSNKFEERARHLLQEHETDLGCHVDLTPHPQGFPDIVLGEFGIEVKVVESDHWRTVGNSVFEGMRDPSVKHIYVLYGKMGGTPTVRWGKYEQCVVHVRTTHRPRFELDMDAKESLFAEFKTTYDEFCKLDLQGKMERIRAYARKHHPGEKLWWLEDKPEESLEHWLPLGIRLYMGLDQEEKRKMRAEAALLCPQVVRPPRAKRKYDDAAIYLITYHGVLCSQARDLFSAGSVALRANQKRGGNYLLRALKDIEAEMRDAASRMEDALFVEYWGENVKKNQRIKNWLVRADGFAVGWKPSKELFGGKGK